MDNIIQLLIFFFIIYAILSPILGKKKTQNQNRERNNIPGEDGQYKTPQRPSSTDILEEMFGFKIPKTEDQFPTNEPSSVNPEYASIPTVDYDTDLNTKYKDLETESKMPDIDYDKIPFNEAEQIPANDESKILSTAVLSRQPIKKKQAIKNLLKSKDSLRNLFLSAEVIGKPKALRR